MTGKLQEIRSPQKTALAGRLRKKGHGPPLRSLPRLSSHLLVLSLSVMRNGWVTLGHLMSQTLAISLGFFLRVKAKP